MAESGSTYLDLQNAILDEIDQRTDLSQQIVNKIIEAIEFYQQFIFLADEAESQWTNCVIQVQTIPLPPQFEAMDSIYANVDGVWIRLEQKDQRFIEDYNVQVPPVIGPPVFYSIYQMDPAVGPLINLAPVPDQAYPMKAIYQEIIPVPANDTTSNFWTVDGEAMIRHRAVAYLRMSVIRSQDYTTDLALAQKEFWRLLNMVNKVQATRKVKPRYL